MDFVLRFVSFGLGSCRTNIKVSIHFLLFEFGFSLEFRHFWVGGWTFWTLKRKKFQPFHRDISIFRGGMRPGTLTHTSVKFVAFRVYEIKRTAVSGCKNVWECTAYNMMERFTPKILALRRRVIFWWSCRELWTNRSSFFFSYSIYFLN